MARPGQHRDYETHPNGSAGRVVGGGGARVGFVQRMDTYRDVNRNATAWLQARGLYSGRGMMPKTDSEHTRGGEGRES